MKAIIFAAGLGTRFKPWTDHHPKALAIVNGKSLLQRNIEYLQQYDIKDVVVNVHHFADQIIDSIQNNNGWGSNIIISDETNAVLETGGGLLHARNLLEGNEPFISLNVDILTNININKMLLFHKQHAPLISLSVSERITTRYFLFDDEGRLCGWKNIKTGEEKISIGTEHLQQKAYSCVAVFQPEIFSFIRQKGKFSLTETYLDLAAEHLIVGYEHDPNDKFVDVGKTESVLIAEELFA